MSRWAPESPSVRFWAKVEASGECWRWTGALLRNGYGYFHTGQRNQVAHRFAWEDMRGEIPDGLVIDHLCRNVACVNPDHLEPVPQRVNVMRGDGPATVRARRAAVICCPAGHEYDAGNTRTDKRGRRSCRACEKTRQAVRYQRVKAAS